MWIFITIAVCLVVWFISISQKGKRNGASVYEKCKYLIDGLNEYCYEGQGKLVFTDEDHVTLYKDGGKHTIKFSYTYLLDSEMLNIFWSYEGGTYKKSFRAGAMKYMKHYQEGDLEEIIEGFEGFVKKSQQEAISDYIQKKREEERLELERIKKEKKQQRLENERIMRGLVRDVDEDFQKDEDEKEDVSSQIKEKQTVTVLSVGERTASNGADFRVVIVEGLPTTYTRSDGSSFIAKAKAGIPSNLSKKILDDMIGKKLPGKIIRKECEPYTYIDSAGEERALNFRYEYVPEEEIKNEEVDDLPF